jgi:hypothetical protein
MGGAFSLFSGSVPILPHESRLGVARGSMEKPPLQFVRVPILRGELVLIESTCTRCLESQVVSAADDSLELWEANHRCHEPEKPKDNVTPMGKR